MQSEEDEVCGVIYGMYVIHEIQVEGLILIFGLSAASDGHQL